MAGIVVALRQAIADALTAGGYTVEHVLPENVRQVGTIGLHAVANLEPYALEAFTGDSWELTATVWLACRHSDPQQLDALLEGALQRLLNALPIEFETTVPPGDGTLHALQGYEIDIDSTNSPARGILKLTLLGSYYR